MRERLRRKKDYWRRRLIAKLGGVPNEWRRLGMPFSVVVPISPGERYWLSFYVREDEIKYVHLEALDPQWFAPADGFAYSRTSERALKTHQ